MQKTGTRIVPDLYPAETALESILAGEDELTKQIESILADAEETTEKIERLLKDGEGIRMKKYTLTMELAIVDESTGETLDTQTDTEYFDTRAEAEQAAARYRAEGIIAEYGEGEEKAVLLSAEVSDEPQEIEF